MQYQVDPMDQTQENGQYLDGSFKMAYASHEKKSQTSTKIFPDMRFSRGSQKKAALS